MPQPHCSNTTFAIDLRPPAGAILIHSAISVLMEPRNDLTLSFISLDPWFHRDLVRDNPDNCCRSAANRDQRRCDPGAAQALSSPPCHPSPTGSAHAQLPEMDSG